METEEKMLIGKKETMAAVIMCLIANLIMGLIAVLTLFLPISFGAGKSPLIIIFSTVIKSQRLANCLPYVALCLMSFSIFSNVERDVKLLATLLKKKNSIDLVEYFSVASLPVGSAFSYLLYLIFAGTTISAIKGAPSVGFFITILLFFVAMVIWMIAFVKARSGYKARTEYTGD